jgi:AcrR family transcriptional regulator
VSRALAETPIERPTRRSRKTRSALVDAARRLLEDEGVGALTVKAVTERADVAHGTFYHHFPSTEAVLAAGIEESMREFSAAMERGFSDAADKTWVFIASMSGTFRMLASHPALPWMLERPHVLAAALREGCGPYARRDVEAMISAGEIQPDAIARTGRYWEWMLVGALVDASGHPGHVASIEANLLGLVLRILGLSEKRVAELLARVASTKAPAKAKR